MANDTLIYDELPPPVRRAIREATFPWAAVSAKEALDMGAPVDYIVRTIRNMDQRMLAKSPTLT